MRAESLSTMEGAEPDARTPSPSPSESSSSSSSSSESKFSAPTPEPDPAADHDIAIAPTTTATPGPKLPKARQRAPGHTPGTFEYTRNVEHRILREKFIKFIERDAGASDIPRGARLEHLFKLRDEFLAANEASGKGSLRTKFPDRWNPDEENSWLGQWAWSKKAQWLQMAEKVARNNSVTSTRRVGTTAADEDDEEPDVMPAIKRELAEKSAAIKKEKPESRGLRNTRFLSSVMSAFVSGEPNAEAKLEQPERDNKPTWRFVGGKLVVWPAVGETSTVPAPDQSKVDTTTRVKREYGESDDGKASGKKPKF